VHFKVSVWSFVFGLMIRMFRSKQVLFVPPVILFILALFVMSANPAMAAMTLVSFTATPGEGQMLVAWETATESENEVETFSLLPALVPGAAAAIATSTPVVTSTPTHTRTPTSTQNGAYPGPVQSPYPAPVQSPTPIRQQTPYPGPATSATPSAARMAGVTATTTNRLEQTGGPTSTLRPFPSITIEFPEATETPAVTSQSIPGPGDSGPTGWVNLARLGPLALILLVWVLLGGWFYLTLRRMQ